MSVFIFADPAGHCQYSCLNEDTRAFFSVPTRHDLSRHIERGFPCGGMAEGLLGAEGGRGAKDLAVHPVKAGYRL